MASIIEVTTTVDSEAAAVALAQKIVDQRKAACVQITGPIQSIYRWHNEICQTQEWRCTMKSLDSRSRELVEALTAIHPYEVPEVLIQSVDDCSEAYLQWLAEQID